MFTNSTVQIAKRNWTVGSDNCLGRMLENSTAHSYCWGRNLGFVLVGTRILRITGTLLQKTAC